MDTYRITVNVNNAIVVNEDTEKAAYINDRLNELYKKYSVYDKEDIKFLYLYMNYEEMGFDINDYYTNSEITEHLERTVSIFWEINMSAEEYLLSYGDTSQVIYFPEQYFRFEDFIENVTLKEQAKYFTNLIITLVHRLEPSVDEDEVNCLTKDYVYYIYDTNDKGRLVAISDDHAKYRISTAICNQRNEDTIMNLYLLQVLNTGVVSPKFLHLVSGNELNAKREEMINTFRKIAYGKLNL